MDSEERIRRAKEVLGRCRVVRKGEAKRSGKKFRRVDGIVCEDREMDKSRYYSCEKKDRYRTQGEATAHMHVLMTIRPGTKLRVYQCQYCSGFHITSKPLKANLKRVSLRNDGARRKRKCKQS